MTAEEHLEVIIQKGLASAFRVGREGQRLDSFMVVYLERELLDALKVLTASKDPQAKNFLEKTNQNYL